MGCGHEASGSPPCTHDHQLVAEGRLCPAIPFTQCVTCRLQGDVNQVQQDALALRPALLVGLHFIVSRATQHVSTVLHWHKLR